jgi:hypothetical protein
LLIVVAEVIGPFWTVPSPLFTKGEVMHFNKFTGWVLAWGIGLGALFAAETSLLAQEARTSKRGKVESLLKNDHDDVDGIRLNSGILLHFPPHMGQRISAVVRVGDTVEVEGRSEVTPRGEQVFEITQLTSGKETIQIEHPRPKPGPKRPRDEQPTTASGKVTDYARNASDDVDGLILDDETVVKFPPHQARELQRVVALGDKVTIEGRRHVTPRGEVHFHADRIEARGSVIERGGPKVGPKGPREEYSEDEDPTNADLLRELKAIRSLLEKQLQR